MRAILLEDGNGAVIYLGRRPILFAEFSAYWRCDHSVEYFERMPVVVGELHDQIAWLKTHTLDELISKIRSILHDFDPDLLENYA